VNGVDGRAPSLAPRSASSPRTPRIKKPARHRVEIERQALSILDTSARSAACRNLPCTVIDDGMTVPHPRPTHRRSFRRRVVHSILPTIKSGTIKRDRTRGTIEHKMKEHINKSRPRSVDSVGLGQCLNCEKKEVAERWKRGAEGAETNAEGVRIEAPKGGECGGVSPSLTD